MADDSPEMIQRLAQYAGKDYAKPRTVEVEEVYLGSEFETFDELLSGLLAFRERNAGHILTLENPNTEYTSVTARRLETPQETAGRIEGYREKIRAKDAARRAEYERMKREFGDA